jgi:hypothetical protein
MPLPVGWPRMLSQRGIASTSQRTGGLISDLSAIESVARPYVRESNQVGEAGYPRHARFPQSINAVWRSGGSASGPHSLVTCQFLHSRQRFKARNQPIGLSPIQRCRSGQTS